MGLQANVGLHGMDDGGGKVRLGSNWPFCVGQ